MYRQYEDMTDEYGEHNNSVASIYCTVLYNSTVQYSIVGIPVHTMYVSYGVLSMYS